MAKLRLDESKIKDATKYVEAGNYAVVVCQFLGISEVTWYNWINKGEKDFIDGKDNIYVKFFKSIKKAESVAEMRNVTIIQSSARENWQAAAWYLERKYKERWGRMDQHQISGKDGGSIQIEDPRDKLLFKLDQMEDSKKKKDDDV